MTPTKHVPLNQVEEQRNGEEEDDENSPFFDDVPDILFLGGSSSSRKRTTASVLLIAACVVCLIVGGVLGSTIVSLSRSQQVEDEITAPSSSSSNPEVRTNAPNNGNTKSPTPTPTPLPTDSTTFTTKSPTPTPTPLPTDSTRSTTKSPTPTPTPLPTEATMPITTTISPTSPLPPPTTTTPQTSPISSPRDVRYGPTQMNLPLSETAYFKEFKSRAGIHHDILATEQAKLKGGAAVHDYLVAAHAKFCAEQPPKPPQTYAFPPAPGEKFDTPLDRQRRCRQYRASIAEYYMYSHFLTDVVAPEETTRPQQYQTTLKRYANIFLHRLIDKKPLVLGFMGTSVMSGQDNCRFLTYPYQVQRQLVQLLQGTDVEVQVRNLGQNGDGPNVDAEMWAARDVFGDDVHIIFTWWAMIGTAQFPTAEWFYRDWAKRGTVFMGVEGATFTEATTGWRLFAQNWDSWFAKQGYFAGPAPANLFAREGFEKVQTWYTNHFWGRPDDGRCHARTREGASGVVMQNWHFGPMGFQMLSDQIMLFLASALELAYEMQSAGKTSIDDDIPPFGPPKPHTASQEVVEMCRGTQYNKPTVGGTNFYAGRECAGDASTMQLVAGTGLAPQWNGKQADLNGSWKIPVPTSFLRLLGGGGGGGGGDMKWTYEQCKLVSSSHGASEFATEHYGDRPECNDFGDVGFAFRLESSSSQQSTTSEWLTFQLPKNIDVNTRFAGVKQFNVLTCTGLRRYPWKFDQAKGWAIEFAIEEGGSKGASVRGSPIPLDNASLEMLTGCLMVGKDLDIALVRNPFGIRLTRQVDATLNLQASEWQVHTILMVGWP